ncbi:hypothetical protein ONZ45_g2100 [Pleurotus djamor]|nr:hypothetical protein ONZ45_g2100 [Pleurotus djamor]
MPGPLKHVHFDIPPTPSPTYSWTSLPSSSGLQTPPSLMHFGSPYNTKPLPNMPVQLHPTLCYSLAPPLNYNISCHPSTVTPAHPSLPNTVLNEAATRPPLPFISIVCKHIPWRLDVRSSNGSFVTVSDVFNGLYHALRLGATKAEFDQLPPTSQNRVSTAYNLRYSRILSVHDRELEKQKGLKRIDFFGEHHRFMGLSPAPHIGSNVWIMHVS